MRTGFIPDVSSAVIKEFRSFHRMLTVSQVGPTPMFSKSFAVLTLSTICWPRRKCSLPSSSAGLCCEFYPDFFVVCTLSHHKLIRSIIRSARFLIHCMSTPRVVRRATWREMRELVTTANGRTFRSTSTSPTCIGLATAVTLLGPWEDVPLLHIGAAGKAVPLQVASERDIGAASSFAAIPQQTLGCASVGAIGDVFFRNTRCFLVGSWPVAQCFLCLGFRSGSRTRDGCAMQVGPLPCKNDTVSARKPSSTTVVRWVSGKGAR